ncbi:MAG TPA: hypothetical protein VHV27_12550 [Phenylobacterium sp.]|nr:hypothetical protein [Phenylobacterium sp.]
MTKFKTLATIAVSALALGGVTATTAQAQPWRHGYAVTGGYDNRLATPYVDGLNWKITNAAQRGLISWPQARNLRAQVRSVHDISWRYQNGQARPGEVNRLAAVVNRVDSLTSGYAYNTRRRY